MVIILIEVVVPSPCPIEHVGTDPTEPVGASAYAKASAYAEASAFALYATADKTARQVGGSSALLEYAVMHDDEAEAARLRAELPPSL